MLSEEKLAWLNAGDVTRLVVALSGGLDSVCLLHSLVTAPLNKPILAIHINHGLQKEADAWQRHCEELCSQLGIELHSFAVEIGPAGSLEENARKARYLAFAAFLEPGDLLLLAHHADDQVETILFNLFRGSEALGIRGMPETRALNGARLYRPFLDIHRSELEAYAELNRLGWVEDSSNQDLRMDRNYLRHKVLPMITARFPGADKALLNGLERDQAASALIQDIARSDLKTVITQRDGLLLSALKDFTERRIVNLLREYLRQKNLPFPSGSLLRECADVMLHAREDAAPALAWLSCEFRRHGDILYLLRALESIDTTLRTPWDPLTKLQIAGGVLIAELKEGQGMRAENMHSLEVRFRQGGEKIQLNRSRRIKKLFQENSVPEWLRSRIPLIFRDGQLVAIPGIPGWEVAPVVSKTEQVEADEQGWFFTFHIKDRF